MIIILTYDISDNKIRARTHKFLKEFGLNTQKSVFECDIDDIALKRIRRFCIESLDFETDSVRIYKVCSHCIRKVIISGQGIKITQLDYAII
jgi:CRISPR-associated protein Cas2